MNKQNFILCQLLCFLNFLPRIAFVLSHSAMFYSFVILWTAVQQAPLSMGFCRSEYWSGLPFPPPGDLPDPGIKPASSASPALAGRFFTS